jgi:hypothetical protein
VSQQRSKLGIDVHPSTLAGAGIGLFAYKTFLVVLPVVLVTGNPGFAQSLFLADGGFLKVLRCHRGAFPGC